MPPRAYLYLFAFLPGLFFEVSILGGNPALICELAARAQDGFGLRRYEMLGLALFLAFVIGSAFMILVGLIKWSLGQLYWFRERSKGLTDTETERKCWAIIARQLLTAKYGINPEKFDQDEWSVLYQSLGTPNIKDVGGSFLLAAFEGIGWSGFTALLFAQGLRNRYYILFSLFLIVAGLLNDWLLVKRMENPKPYALLKIRTLLREFQTTGRKGQSPIPRTEPEGSTGGNLEL